MKRSIIIDNAPSAYAFSPQNALAISSWFSDVRDTELLDLIPMLEELAKTSNVYSVLSRMG